MDIQSLTEEEIIKEDEREGDYPLYISSPLPYSQDSDMTHASLIAELEAKVKLYRACVEEYRSKLRVWESALKSALEEKGDSGAREKPVRTQVKGRVSRAFVRDVLKKHAKSGGVTPKQIRQIADEQGLAYPVNFPNTTLHKFRTQPRPEVREEDGKYFPILPE